MNNKNDCEIVLGKHEAIVSNSWCLYHKLQVFEHSSSDISQSLTHKSLLQ